MIRSVLAGRKIKVVIALYYYAPYVSGLTVYAKWIAEALVQRGYEVTIITSHYDASLPKQEVVNSVKVIRKPVWFRFGKGVIMPMFWLDVVRHAFKSDYVNIHLPMTEGGLASLLIPQRKLVSTYHCDLYLGESFLDKIITVISLGLMKLQLTRSRVIIANTRDYFEHSQMRRFIPKLLPVYPPVPAPSHVTDVQGFFKDLGVKKNEVKIGFVGRIVYEKGLSYLLGAIPYLRKELPDFKIIMMGDYAKVAGGGVKDELDKYMAQYPDNILFTGFLDDADRNRFYAGLDVFALPSIDPLESFGMVQVEAMLGGAPVVASDMPGVREVIKQTGYGRISKPKDAKDIAKQIVEIVKHSQRYQPQKAAVQKYFNPEDTIDAYVDCMPR